MSLGWRLRAGIPPPAAPETASVPLILSSGCLLIPPASISNYWGTVCYNDVNDQYEARITATGAARLHSSRLRIRLFFSAVRYWFSKALLVGVTIFFRTLNLLPVGDGS
jgi:hypothetical protein